MRRSRRLKEGRLRTSSFRPIAATVSYCRAVVVQGPIGTTVSLCPERALPGFGHINIQKNIVHDKLAQLGQLVL